MDSFLSIIIICVISSISSATSIQLFSEEGIIHRLGEGFYHIKSYDRGLYFILFKTRSSTGVNVLGGIYVIVKARQRGNYAANSPSPRALARGRGLSQHNFRGNRCFNYYISRLNCLFIFMDSFLSIIIICAISSKSSSTSIQLFSEEGIIHRLGEGFYHIKSDDLG